MKYYLLNFNPFNRNTSMYFLSVLSVLQIAIGMANPIPRRGNKKSLRTYQEGLLGITKHWLYFTFFSSIT